MEQDTEFGGAKLVLFMGDRIAVILRDDFVGLDWPGFLDFPGGGREGDEGPLACALRETQEELGIAVPEAAVVWQRRFQRTGRAPVWFFVARLPAARAADIRLGDEGQSWHLMTPGDYIADPRAIPHFRERLRIYLLEQAQGSGG